MSRAGLMVNSQSTDNGLASAQVVRGHRFRPEIACEIPKPVRESVRIPLCRNVHPPKLRPSRRQRPRPSCPFAARASRRFLQDWTLAVFAGVGSFVGEGFDLSGDEPYSSHGRELLSWDGDLPKRIRIPAFFFANRFGDGYG